MSQSIEKLRKKVEQKSKEAQFFKDKYVAESYKHDILKNEIEKLKRELHVSNAHIVDIAKEKGVVEAPTNFSEIKVGEASIEKKNESSVAFSSRFMPDCKFRYNGKIDFIKKTFDEIPYSKTDFCYIDDGNNCLLIFEDRFHSMQITEVSIYEAIPELVPKDMVYDKENDILVYKHWASLVSNIQENLEKPIEVIKSELKELLADKKEVVESSTTFSSRFMPDCKFRYNGKIDFIKKTFDEIPYSKTGFCYIDDGNNCLLIFEDRFHSMQITEVSIYEAIPELVPKDMVYDKKSDSLVQKTCDNQMCGGEFYDCEDGASKESKETNSIEISVEFSNILEKLQVFLWNTNFPILKGVEFTCTLHRDDVRKRNYTVSFTTIDVKKS